MYPEAFGLLSLYPLALLLGAIVGTAITVRSLGGPAALGCRGLAFLLTVGCLALASAKLWSIVERGGPVWDLAWELRSGYRYPGGVLAAALCTPLLARRLLPGVPLLRLADAQALSIPFAVALVRVGCLLAGCCHGTATDLPWGVRFPADTAAWWLHSGRGWIAATDLSSQPVHPLQIYFLAASLVTGLFLLRSTRARRFDGDVLFQFLVIDGSAKALLEALRDPHEPRLQMAAVLMALMGLAGLALKRRNSRRHASTRAPVPLDSRRVRPSSAAALRARNG